MKITKSLEAGAIISTWKLSYLKLYPILPYFKQHFAIISTKEETWTIIVQKIPKQARIELSAVMENK